MLTLLQQNTIADVDVVTNCNKCLSCIFNQHQNFWVGQFVNSQRIRVQLKYYNFLSFDENKDEFKIKNEMIDT